MRSKNGVGVANIHVLRIVDRVSEMVKGFIPHWIMGHSPMYRDALKGTPDKGCGRKYKWWFRPSQQELDMIRKEFPYLDISTSPYGFQTNDMLVVKVYMSDISYMEDMAQTNLMDYPECEG